MKRLTARERFQRLPKWKKKLTAKERAHVDEWGGKTLAGFRETRRRQRIGTDTCFDCRIIARKLGLE